MTNWHDEIVAGVQQQFNAAAEAAESERNRREAAIDFWRRMIDVLKSFCEDANRQLGKQIFTSVPVSQDNNYVCSITYSGPIERLGGVSLDTDLRSISITIPDQSEKFTLKAAEDKSAVAVHANDKQFKPTELAEEVIRSITQIEAGRKFIRPARNIRLNDEETIMLREW